jgi:hypothetical protein
MVKQSFTRDEIGNVGGANFCPVSPRSRRLVLEQFPLCEGTGACTADASLRY